MLGQVPLSHAPPLTLPLATAVLTAVLSWPALGELLPPPLPRNAPHVVSLPSKPWGVALELDGFSLRIDDLKSDGRRYLIASHPTTGLTVSLTLNPVSTLASMDSCIAHVNQRAASPLASHAQDLALTTTSALPTIEYTVLEVKPRPLSRRHVHLCHRKDNVFLELHLTKAPYMQADEDLFRALLKTLQIIPVRHGPRWPGGEPTSVVGSSLDLFTAGSEFYLQGDYPQAIVLYEQALDLDRATPVLDRIMWRTLVDNLGMAYGISGKLAQARAMFEHGIEEEHSYPMFHYHLACTFAEMNDRERTMASLRSAVRFRKYHNPADPGLPDPRGEISFRRFMTHKDFRTFVDRLMAHAGEKSSPSP